MSTLLDLILRRFGPAGPAPGDSMDVEDSTGRTYTLTFGERIPPTTEEGTTHE